MKTALKHEGRATAGMPPAAVLVGLGLAALVFLAVLVPRVIWWIIS